MVIGSESYEKRQHIQSENMDLLYYLPLLDDIPDDGKVTYVEDAKDDYIIEVKFFDMEDMRAKTVKCSLDTDYLRSSIKTYQCGNKCRKTTDCLPDAWCIGCYGDPDPDASTYDNGIYFSTIVCHCPTFGFYRQGVCDIDITHVGPIDVEKLRAEEDKVQTRMQELQEIRAELDRLGPNAQPSSRETVQVDENRRNTD